jgi:hypothetical protein
MNAFPQCPSDNCFHCSSISARWLFIKSGLNLLGQNDGYELPVIFIPYFYVNTPYNKQAVLGEEALASFYSKVNPVS